MEDTTQISTKNAFNCHAERCPVCNGFGSVNWGKLTCNACKGKGFVIIPNAIGEEEKERRRRKTNEPIFK